MIPERDKLEALCRTIEKKMKALAQAMADAFNARGMKHVRLMIIISGDLKEGKMRIGYSVDDSLFGRNSVEGGTILATLDEFARRRGWEKTNQSPMLEFDAEGQLVSTSKQLIEHQED